MKGEDKGAQNGKVIIKAARKNKDRMNAQNLVEYIIDVIKDGRKIQAIDHNDSKG